MDPNNDHKHVASISRSSKSSRKTSEKAVILRYLESPLPQLLSVLLLQALKARDQFQSLSLRAWECKNMGSQTQSPETDTSGKD